MPVSDAVIKKLEDLKANIQSFLKLHNNPYDTSQYNELAAKLERIETILASVNNGGDGHTGDCPDDVGGNGSSSLSGLKNEVEQARAEARTALDTVDDLNASPVTIGDAEKAKVEAYVAKAKEFLDAYAGAEAAEKTAFDQYATEIQQSHDWNANDFLPRANGTGGETSGDTSLDGLKGAVEQARNGAKEALATVADLNASPVVIDDAEKAKVEAYIAKADEFLQAYESAEDTEKNTFDQSNNGYVAEIQQSRDWNANDFLPRANGEAPNTGDSSGGTGGYNNTGKLLFEDKAVGKHGQEFITKLKDVCSRLGLEPDFLMATIDAECNFDHKAVNPSSGATGLIQFMPSTAESLGTTTQAIGNMSALQQLDYVYDYFKSFGSLVSEISEPAESYLIVFYPYAVGRPDSYVLGSQDGPGMVAAIARQNAIYDLDGDGQVTKGEVMEYMRNNKYKGAYDRLEASDDSGGDNTGSNTGSSTGSGQAMSGSVGRNGTNNEADVRKVQELLNQKEASLTVDGVYGNNTLQAIVAFQRSIGLSGDGLVEPGKSTWQGLNGSEGSASARPTSSTTPGTPPGVIPDKLKDVDVKALVPSVPYHSQLDNAINPHATCNVSSCAMAVSSVSPGLFASDDEYHQALKPYLSNPSDTTAHGPHTQMLADKGIRSQFYTTLTYADVIASLDAGKAVVIGVLHRGTLSNPSGSHMIAVVGYYDGGFICNDPYGNSFSYDSDDGANCPIPYESLDARWLVDGPGSGWGRIFE